MYSSEPYPTAPSPVQISPPSRVPVLAALTALAVAGLTLLVLVVALGIGSNSGSLPQRRDMAPPAAKLTPLVQHSLPQHAVKLGR